MSDEDAKTLWCGNLSEQITEELLYELFLQAGPLEKVRIPKGTDGRQRNFAFVTFAHEVSVPYAINLLQGTALFNRTLSLQCRNQSASLAPPIRSTSDPSIDFAVQANLRNQFAEMAENYFRQQSFPPLNGEQHSQHNALHRGKWGPRQHPYRADKRDRGADGNGNRYRGREEARDVNPWEGGRRDNRRDERRHFNNNTNRRKR